MTKRKTCTKIRSPRFGLRGLVLVLPVLVAFALLNARPRFPNYEPILETTTVGVDAGLGEDTQYGWPLTWVDVHYTIRPTLTIDFNDLGLAHYQVRWLSLLSNIVVFIATTVSLYALCYLASRRMKQPIANSPSRAGFAE
ncbi:MAG: hypothetical protein AAGG48_31910 [Planctomycetota bacterium]